MVETAKSYFSLYTSTGAAEEWLQKELDRIGGLLKKREELLARLNNDRRLQGLHLKSQAQKEVAVALLQQILNDIPVLIAPMYPVAE
jgi:hypothetical protein